MAKLSTPAQGRARSLAIRAAAALFFAQALAFVFSADGRIAFARGAVSPAIALAGDICLGAIHDPSKAPGDDRERRHCALCPARCAGQTADVAFPAVRPVLFVEPVQAETPFSPPRRRAGVSAPAGWSRFCFSRAPPRA